jgi:transcriptional regulator with PAS, ATPase and Fis domain
MKDYNPEVSLEELEKRYIEAALDFHAHNRSRTAKALGITKQTLLRKMQKFGLSRPYNPVQNKRKESA